MRGCQNYSKTAEHIVGKGQERKCESFPRRLCGGPELKKLKPVVREDLPRSISVRQVSSH